MRLDDLPPLMTMDDVARFMRIPKRSIRRMVAIGLLPSIKLRRLVRIPTSDMLAVLAENQQAREKARIERAILSAGAEPRRVDEA